MRIFKLIRIWLIWLVDPQTPSHAADAFLLADRMHHAGDRYALAAVLVNKAAWAITRGNYKLACDRLAKAEECLYSTERYDRLGIDLVTLKIKISAILSSPHIVFRPRTPEP